MKKKILSLALALSLVLAFVPAAVAAETSGDPVAVMVSAANMDDVMVIDSEGNLWAAKPAYGTEIRGKRRFPYIVYEGGRIARGIDFKQIMKGTKFKYVDTYKGRIMAIDVDGGLWAWGRGALGDGNFYEYGSGASEPVKIMDGTRFTSVSTGSNLTLALDENGGVWVWGDGNWTIERGLLPKRQVYGRNIKSVWAGTNSHIGSRGNAIDENGVMIALSNDASSDTHSLSTRNIRWTNVVNNNGSMNLFALDKDGFVWILRTNDNREQWWLEGKKIIEDTRFISVSTMCSNYDRMIAIDVDGNLWTWLAGSISHNDPKHEFRDMPQKIESYGIKFTQVSGQYAIDRNGGLWLIGENLVWDDGINRSRSDGSYGIDNIWGNTLDTASSWARDGITVALNKGFVPTEIQENYRMNITRAEFCNMAVNWLVYSTDAYSSYTLLSEEAREGFRQNIFTDTFDVNVAIAYTLGITSGVGNNKFDPDGSITREQAAAMIMRTLAIAGFDTSNVTPVGFVDIDRASPWAVDAINYVRNAGVMAGTQPGFFSPKATYTREQAIVTFNNIKHDTLPGR